MPDDIGELVLPPEVETWVAEHVGLAGAIRLFHERPWGTVWQVLVVDGVVWLKVCAPVQAFEPHLTATLASRWPSLLPEVLANDDARGWLLLGDAGERLGFGSGPIPWVSLLPAYADLQRGEAAHATQHLDAGVPDRRLGGFPALYDAMLAHELPLTTIDRARLQAFAPRFDELCEELESAGIPATIQHDDLHGNNVYPRTMGSTCRTPRILRARQSHWALCQSVQGVARAGCGRGDRPPLRDGAPQRPDPLQRRRLSDRSRVGESSGVHPEGVTGRVAWSFLLRRHWEPSAAGWPSRSARNPDGHTWSEAVG